MLRPQAGYEGGIGGQQLAGEAGVERGAAGNAGLRQHGTAGFQRGKAGGDDNQLHAIGRKRRQMRVQRDQAACFIGVERRSEGEKGEARRVGPAVERAAGVAEQAFASEGLRRLAGGAVDGVRIGCRGEADAEFIQALFQRLGIAR